MAEIDGGNAGKLFPENISKKQFAILKALCHQASATQNSWAGFTRYLNEFLIPCLIASNYIKDVEKLRILTTSPLESWQAYIRLWRYNLDLSSRGLSASHTALNQYGGMELNRAIDAVFNTIIASMNNKEQIEDVLSYIERHANIIQMVAHGYPQAI
jgi:hypothetical protein